MTGNRVHAMRRSITILIALVCLATSTGCATRLTVDDGRRLDSRLLSDMRTYGAALKALRPAIVRSAELDDPDCSNQYELPFDALTSYGIGDADIKVAWLRTLGVNENLTVIAADPSAGLRAGDIVAGVDGHTSRNKQKLAAELIEARDRGEPFALKLASGRKVTVSPLKAAPTTAAAPCHAAPRCAHAWGRGARGGSTRLQSGLGTAR